LVSNQVHSFLTTIQISTQMCVLSFEFYIMALGAVPDIQWIVEGACKTVIYCDTISLAFRLLVYLWHCLPTSPQTHSSQIQLYCSLCFASYNECTISYLWRILTFKFLLQPTL
jgi:hypothetical protein